MTKEAPQEIEGIDVTNVPAELQENFLAQVRIAQTAEANLPAAQAAVEAAIERREHHVGILTNAEDGLKNWDEVTKDGGYQVYAGEARDAKSKLFGAKREVDEANDFARDFVAESPDIEEARAEMQRALKENIEEKLG